MFDDVSGSERFSTYGSNAYFQVSLSAKKTRSEHELVQKISEGLTRSITAFSSDWKLSQSRVTRLKMTSIIELHITYSTIDPEGHPTQLIMRCCRSCSILWQSSDPHQGSQRRRILIQQTHSIWALRRTPFRQKKYIVVDWRKLWEVLHTKNTQWIRTMHGTLWQTTAHEVNSLQATAQS